MNPTLLSLRWRSIYDEQEAGLQVLVCHYSPDSGEWRYGIAAAPVSYPWTYWQPLGPPLTNDALLALWNVQEAAEGGSDQMQDALAAELERRGVDL